MKTKTMLVAVLVAVGGCLAAVLWINNHTVPPEIVRVNERPAQVNPPPVVAPVVISPTLQIQVTTAANTLPPETPTNSNVPSSSKPQAAVAQPEIAPLDPVAKEQLGRAALSYVGADPLADQVWASLIYDSSLPDTVREDLMEDLNENGFSGGNGNVATVEDLPLIETRIALLEEHMQGADEFMLEHLAEAHKDLVNIWVRLTRPQRSAVPAA